MLVSTTPNPSPPLAYGCDSKSPQDALTAVAYYVFKADVVLSFWVVYILTRPLGASCGDLLSQPYANGGLGFGVVDTSILFLVSIVGLVIYLTLSGRDQASEAQ